MDWKKIAPWNWFRDEELGTRATAHSIQSPRAQDPLTAIRSEMERLFEDTVRRSFPFGTEMSRRIGLDDPLFAPLRPSVDISEGPKAYTVRVELPGVEREDVSIEIEDGRTLVLRAEKRREHENESEDYHCIENSYGSVQRILSLPDDADVEAIEATFKDGILKLNIPKHPERAAKKSSVEIR